MSSAATSLRVRGEGARLARPAGSLPAGVDLSIALDETGLTLIGGTPLTVWQLPLSTLHGARATRVGEFVELSGWVAGSHLLVTIPERRLDEGSIDDVVALVEGRALQSPGDLDHLDHELTQVVGHRRAAWMAALAIVVAGVVIAIVVALVLGSSSTTTQSVSSAAKASDIALAKSMNLRASDLPTTWGEDSPSTSPLSSLLGTAPSSKPTAQSRRVYQEIVGEFQRCMGLSNATDRMFGAAGVLPVTQQASVPFGTVEGANLIEVGSLTQVYASTSDVQADLAQMKKTSFSRCFAQTMGRLELSGADPSQATSTPPVVVSTPRRELAAYVTGATVTLRYPSPSGTVPIEVGTSIIVAGRFEQTLFTFASPDSFPSQRLDELESLLAARLSGVGSASAA